MTTNLLKLLIVDDSEPVRTSLMALLDRIPGIDVVFTAGTLAEALASVEQVLPALVVLDLHLPDGNAIGAIGAIKRAAPGVQIAVFTNEANGFYLRKCLDAGSDWFFDKSTEVGELLDVVRQLTLQHGADSLRVQRPLSSQAPAPVQNQP